MSIFQKSVKNPITTALIYVAIVIIGVYSYSKLAVDLLPDLGTNNILVLTSYEGASASDIETNVTKPLENVLNGVSNLKHINANSKENVSVIALEFEYGIDVEEATNDIRDKLDLVSSMLPDGVSKPIIFKFSTEAIPILMLSVQSEESTNALYKILDERIVSPLSRVEGVGAVSIQGAPQREINIYCDPYKLDSYGLTVEGITNVIRAENLNLPLGNMDMGSSTFSIRTIGEFDDYAAMNDIVVGSFNNRNVYLKDVAVVKDTVQERVQEVYNNGVRGASIIIQKQTGGNTVNTAKEIKKRLPELMETLPEDIKIGVIYDTSDDILNTIGSLREAIITILILVVVVVMMFLGRWRATFIIAIVIPVSLVASFIYLAITGNSLNVISLSSLSIAIGMVVDDAIVVLENISKHISRGSKPKSAAVYATNEVYLSVVASTLVLLAVFLPMTTLSGLAGVLFKQMGWIMTIVIVVSLLASITLTPMMSSVMLKAQHRSNSWFDRFQGKFERQLDKLDLWYSKVLGLVLKWRVWVIVGALVIFIASLFLAKVIPTEFFSHEDNGRLTVTVKLPMGTRLEESRALGLELTQRFQENFPEMIHCNFNVGQPSDQNTFGRLFESGSHMLSFNMRFTKKTERERGIQEISDITNTILGEYPQINTYFVRLGGGGGAGGQSTVVVEIYGNDFLETDKFAATIADKVLQDTRCGSAKISREEYTPEVSINFDRRKLAEKGLNVGTAATLVKNRIGGAIASVYREDGHEYMIRVRLAPEFRENLNDIRQMTLFTPQGAAVKVGELAQIDEVLTPPTIERKNRSRIVKVEMTASADVPLSDLAEIAKDALDQTELPQGITTELAGTYQDQQESFADLALLMVLILILVFIVMASQFESFVYPFVIIFSIPFALTGVLLGLSVTGTPLGLMAMLGLVLLIGIVVKNGIVLIDYTILLRERGHTVEESVVMAGRSRLRPILMTTITTVLGMIPLAIGKGEGAEMWNPLGMTVAWGLTFSTMITLLLIPMLYASFARYGEKRRARKQRKLLEKSAAQSVVE
ncbi:MAG TPA: efflux RND transporter permease subunit [Bacteroidales bacterium]|nr:efflux RND transporter permease subunit [Bacteroidales bacterium]HQB75820.1 efflux RND transporter permease subunit [Bacteroidales bacterium]